MAAPTPFPRHHNRPGDDFAGAGDFELEFGDAVDERLRVPEQLAQEGFLALVVRGRVGGGRGQDGEEAAGGSEGVVDCFEEGVGVLDLGGGGCGFGGEVGAVRG